MAGSFVTIVNPGYSTLFTRDLPAVSNDDVSGSTTANLFDPDVTNPLQEGEWLEINDDYQFVRPASTDVTSHATGTVSQLTIVDITGNTPTDTPCFMYFQERGRYDAQVTRKAHCIVGPEGFEFRTKMIVCSSGDEGDRVFVVIAKDSGGRLVSCLASSTALAAASVAYTENLGPSVSSVAANVLTDGSWYAGTITRIHGTNDATVLFQPGNL